MPFIFCLTHFTSLESWVSFSILCKGSLPDLFRTRVPLHHPHPLSLFSGLKSWRYHCVWDKATPYCGGGYGSSGDLVGEWEKGLACLTLTLYHLLIGPTVKFCQSSVGIVNYWCLAGEIRDVRCLVWSRIALDEKNPPFPLSVHSDGGVPLESCWRWRADLFFLWTL